MPDFSKKNILQIKQYLLIASLLLMLMAGCDQATRHKALSTLFDGVPDLPPADQLCEDYVEELEATRMNPQDGGPTADAATPSGSTHAPYGEKDCGGCHKTGASNELLVPATELCMTCHVDFIQGPNVHGPIAVGDCLACHLPHQSQYSSLLVKDRTEICSKCHKEARLASALHEKVDLRGLTCVDCHGAHFGKNQYFLN